MEKIFYSKKIYKKKFKEKIMSLNNFLGIFTSVMDGVFP